MPVLYVAGVSLTDNPKDVPLKTLDIIRNCQTAIGEDRKNAIRLLKAASSDAELYLINEHSGDKERKEALEAILKCERSVFFSDAGTACISDPDYRFISMSRKAGVIIKTLPGPCSITAAISVSGIDVSSFFFAGFPPKEKEKRKNFFNKINKSAVTAVFMERPYALETTLKDMLFIKRKISISINLGMDGEENLFDYPDNLLKKLSGIKAPFVMVIPKNIG